jgi:hypothetical protein
VVMSRRVLGGEAGKVKLGCLFTLLVVAAAFYFGIDFLHVRLRFYQIQDAVQTQANFAPALDDITIRNRLVARSDSLGIPLGPLDWTIKRTYSPRQIDIHATYYDSVVIEVPGFRKVFYFAFNPHATELY